jgi:hypothetical protein
LYPLNALYALFKLNVKSLPKFTKSCGTNPPPLSEFVLDLDFDFDFDLDFELDFELVSDSDDNVELELEEELVDGLLSYLYPPTLL